MKKPQISHDYIDTQLEVLEQTQDRDSAETTSQQNPQLMKYIAIAGNITAVWMAGGWQ